MQSMIAVASAAGVALGGSRLEEPASAKMGRTSNVHPGQIAGASEPRRATNMPATNVPCWQAALLALVHAALVAFGTSRIRALERSRCAIATGPSINPTAISGLPVVRLISARSLTSSTAATPFNSVERGSAETSAPSEAGLVNSIGRLRAVSNGEERVVGPVHMFETLAMQEQTAKGRWSYPELVRRLLATFEERPRCAWDDKRQPWPDA